MKKLSLLAFIVMLCIACSTEETTTLDEGTNLEVTLENYEGVFTTLDGQNRGTLEVTLSEDNRFATGNLTLASGEIIPIYTDQITTVGNTKELIFSSNDLSFTMTSAEEGEIMEIEAVNFRGLESSIIAGRNTDRAPLTTVTGTFTCSMCPAPLDNMSTQTFNLMFMNAGGNDGSVTTQTTLDGTMYAGVATQSGCVVNGGQTTCNLNSGTMLGVTGVAFNPGGGDVTWSGTHIFDNGPSGANDCSTISGTWQWASSTIGTVGGAFASDVMNDCPPPMMDLITENFETAIGTPPSSGYVVRNEFVTGGAGPTDSNAVEYSEAPALDYFGRITTAEFTGGEVNITNVQGSRFFGAADIDQSGNPNDVDFDIGSINWFNFDVSSISTMRASALFAEANENGSESWDNNSSVRIQYSTDNSTWITFFAIESTGDNTAPRIDSSPFDGFGDGAEITTTLTEYTSIDVDVSAINTISVRIIFEGLNGAREDIGIDNFVLSGN